MSTAGAPGPSPERVEGPTAPCGMRPTPATQNCTLLGFRVQPPCLPPSSGEEELVAWLTLKPIFAIKFSHCFGGVAQNLGNQKIEEQLKSKAKQVQGRTSTRQLEIYLIRFLRTHKVILGVQLEASELTDCQFHMVPRKSFCSGLNCGTYTELLKRILGQHFIFDKNPRFPGHRRAVPNDPAEAIYQRPGTVASSIWPHTFNAKNLPCGNVLGPVLKIRSAF